jgi:hypothetical protein
MLFTSTNITRIIVTIHLSAHLARWSSAVGDLPEEAVGGVEVKIVPMPDRSGGPPVVLRSQFNRSFVVGLAGATIASLGLLTLSRAGGEIGDDGRAKLNATSDGLSGRQKIARTFRSDIEVTAFNLPPIQFGNRE